MNQKRRQLVPRVITDLAPKVSGKTSENLQGLNLDISGDFVLLLIKKQTN